jgi:4-alpha-glucanotransferase
MADPEQWGVEVGYHDAAGAWREPPRATIDAVLQAMGADRDRPPTETGLPVPSGRLELEDGSTVDVSGAMPPDLPFGYHRFVPATGGEPHPVIVSPRRCWLPSGPKTWGWSAQLYAARSMASWGIGDLADLRHLNEWAVVQGAGLSMINPLHAALLGDQQSVSPYFASSRCFRNPLYLHIEDIPGAARLPNLDRLSRAGHALNGIRRIDRDAVWQLKSDALEALFADFSGDPAFDRYRAEQGAALDQFATFSTIAERHGVDWEKWPPSLRRPDGPGIMPLAASRNGGHRIRYHAWLQWLLDVQLRTAVQPLGLVHDLAVGADPRGADSWRWQDCLAMGVTVGAPPDEYNTVGQDWGFPPFDPWRLRAAGYQPFIEVIRAGLRHATGLRVDHVMGLFRLFWIPSGADAAEGTYVRYPWSDLLDILALESSRAGAYIIGEDLGTVEDSTRRELAERGVLSYRLLWFEPTPPNSGLWPEQALAAVTTHDLPTIAGLWTGADLEVQRALDLHPNEKATQATRDRLASWLGVGQDAPVGEVIQRAYRLLGQAPCVIASATLEDALAVKERPNMPGTIGEWPNWSLALPRPFEELQREPLAEAIAVALNERIGGPSTNT